MSASAAPRTARFYTAARRHPWVLGKLADWRLPLGPYNAAQIGLAVVGGFVLVKTLSVWSVLAPLPVAAWLVGIWLLRRPKIGGRHPMAAALGMVALFVQPRGGRIGQHAARDPRASRLGGGFTLEDFATPAPAPAPGSGPAPTRPVAAPRRSRSRTVGALGARPARRVGPVRMEGSRPTRPARAPQGAAPAAAAAPAATLLAQARLQAQSQLRGA
ncbi:hypothetical protein AB0I66_00155 [Streptomyces sp. NPDC050439]|uniref:hypothetical protein n=1 Tax=unclassified Streptomyces TaxID=2593676 RepID=UPI0034253077